ncbi:sarcolemmal membrane-associated protein-like isoform X4 [Saccostrea echinata]|uniref:sarcolemmal membrane-associated protein-like isoform X4 n=1 Tax=Saccostrea echinata TaxID=191078 RepID=UPI002A7FE9DA|nr:sarcolemmal membrane-associated protein-like isoform X4 [Saccostrea echinata]
MNEYPGSDYRETMSSVVILSSQPNSHPFQERHISLIEPVKIGRSVARARPASNNGIFDCKVLSRNHAVVWYENGKFYLKDTKSSNGTFINNQRLSRGGEESAPREIFSGDHIQFGVDVMDNNKRGEKITHNCITATVTLFHPDGREARNVYSESGQFANTVSPGVTIQSQELYQLAQYLQEALHREKMLEQKLGTLQQLVDNTQEASENGWQALIDEDRLLSRLEVLENQLHIYSKNHAEDTLRQEVVTLQEEKNTYETTAKESLKRVLQEKLEAVRKLSDLERSLHNTEDECAHLKEMCEKAQEELQALAEKYQDQQKEVIEIQEKLQEAERHHLEEVEKLRQEKEDLNEKLEEMIRQETILTAKMESIQADNDIAMEQLAAMKEKLEAIKEPKENVIEENGEGLTNGDRTTDEVINTSDRKVIVGDDIKIIMTDDENDNKLEDIHKPDNLNNVQNNIDDVDSMKINSEKSSPEDIQGKLRDAQKQIEKYKELIRESDVKMKESSDKLEAVQKELERAETDAKQYITKIASLEEKLKLSDLHLNLMMENTMADLKQQLKVSQHQTDNSSGLITELQEKVHILESEIRNARLPPEKMEATLVATCASKPTTTASQMDESNDSGLEDDDNLKELLREARVLQTKAETELKKCRDELNVSKTEVQRKDEETSNLKDQLCDAQKLTQDQSKMVVDLQDQLKRAETQTKEVKQQILDLRDQLMEEQKIAKNSQEEMIAVTCELDQEKLRNKETKKELEETKSKHLESQQAAKQTHNEAEQLKNKVRQLQERLDSERRTSSHYGTRSLHLDPHGRDSHGRDSHGRDTHSRELSHGSSSLRDTHHGSHRELHKTNSGGHTPSSPSGKQRGNIIGEFTALKEECSSLRKRIQAIEAEMKMSRKENLQLSAEYNKLQESYRQLEATKDQLESQASAWQSNLTDSQKENEQTRQQVGDNRQPIRGLVTAGSNVTGSPGQQLQEATAEVASLRSKCQEYKDRVSELEVEMSLVHEQYKHLSDRTKVLSFASSIPLLMLLFAILMALYPTLAQITATTV